MSCSPCAGLGEVLPLEKLVAKIKVRVMQSPLPHTTTTIGVLGVKGSGVTTFVKALMYLLTGSNWEPPAKDCPKWTIPVHTYLWPREFPFKLIIVVKRVDSVASVAKRDAIEKNLVEALHHNGQRVQALFYCATAEGLNRSTDDANGVKEAEVLRQYFEDELRIPLFMVVTKADTISDLRSGVTAGTFALQENNPAIARLCAKGMLFGRVPYSRIVLGYGLHMMTRCSKPPSCGTPSTKFHVRCSIVLGALLSALSEVRLFERLASTKGLCNPLGVIVECLQGQDEAKAIVLGVLRDVSYRWAESGKQMKEILNTHLENKSSAARQRAQYMMEPIVEAVTAIE